MDNFMKMQAILAKLMQIPFQSAKLRTVSAHEALAKIRTQEELDFYYNKLVERQDSHGRI